MTVFTRLLGGELDRQDLKDISRIVLIGIAGFFILGDLRLKLQEIFTKFYPNDIFGFPVTFWIGWIIILIYFYKIGNN